jgi:hypothetical protein
MADLAVQTPTLSGVTVSYVSAAGGGDRFTNNGTTFLYFKSTGAAISVTANSVTACDQGFDHDITVQITSTGETVVGPFPTARFNSADGKVDLTYTGVTGVTVAAFSAT